MNDTHDYRDRRWGHDYVIHRIYEGGMRLDMGGWGLGLRAGDYILMNNASGETRYQIATIKYQDDPPDMWFAKAVFAPRQVD